ncbi:hypothetical protein DL93DRAFT_2090252 [Clavulina sp. PMI_390]|nr:hypothetical protein DL93DRAFT_2090252 [Clavulina sp. PMI_390]
MMARGPSDATAKDSVLKVRGPPAQLKIAIDDIEVAPEIFFFACVRIAHILFYNFLSRIVFAV